MKRKVLKLLSLGFVYLCFSCQNDSNALLIAAGGGYKKPVQILCQEFSADTGIAVDALFGNMQTLSMQVKQSGEVALLIGDKTFLSNPAIGVEYEEYITLGEGKLVLAYPQGGHIDKVEDLLLESTAQIAMPDTEKAIYGVAGMEYLNSLGLWEVLKEKILIASTVPQVSSYLISGEINAGFINLTDAIGIEDKIGGYIIVEPFYHSIEIVAGVVQGFGSNENLTAFIQYLESEKAQEILKSYGL